MKIRTDFVTNSSSSSFTVEVVIHTKDNNIKIYDDPCRYSPDAGGESKFDGDLRQANQHLASVKELAAWLADSVKQDWWRDPNNASFKKKKSKFVKEACEAIQDVEEIEKITVTRNYDAWGEAAELIADSDDELNRLARLYLASEGIEKERAEAEMITYIQTKTDARGSSFGSTSCISRYSWSGTSVEQLAERLCSEYGPRMVSGVERKSIDLKTGEYVDASEFNLA